MGAVDVDKIGGTIKELSVRVTGGKMDSVCSLVDTHLQGLGGETLGESRPPWEGLRKMSALRLIWWGWHAVC